MGRALMHLNVIADVRVGAKVIDVGGGRRQTYLDYIDMDSADEFMSVDIEFTGPGKYRQVCASVTDMPFETGSIDTVLCFNLLEHVFDHCGAISEISRVLRPRGVMYGWTPFIFQVHGAPDDYWRYSDTSMVQLLSAAGFNAKATYHGSTFTAIFDMLAPYCKFGPLTRPVRIVLAGLALLTTSAVAKLAGRVGSPRPWDCPNGVWFVAARVS